MKFDKTKIVLALRVLLNLLGGTGTIPPVVGGPSPCAPCPACPTK